MTPIQQLFLGAGGAAEKTYIDNVFGTYLWKGTGSSNAVNNSIDLAGKGGMTWIKNRSIVCDSMLYDTERGVTKFFNTNDNGDEGTESGGITAFNSNGFTVGGNGESNQTNAAMSSWTFRKAKGFFDVVTYTGTGTKRTVNHSLGCKPGMIIIKRRNEANSNFEVWHKSLGGSNNDNNYMVLNDTTAATGTSRFGTYGTDDPTSTTFTVKDQAGVNENGGTYVAYVFAGGESDAATARSVEFDGSGDYLSLASSSDFAFGTGDFTIEFWVKPHSTSGANQLFDFRTDGGSANQTGKFNLMLKIKDEVVLKGASSNPDIGVPHSKYPVNPGTWSHIAVVRNSSTTTVYVNGIAGNSASDTNDYTAATLLIGKNSQSSSNNLDGEISNFRVVKGTAVYTSSFRPTDEPLTNITNTKLLCCNNSSTTGSTVTPGTITANGDPTASTDSPFDDPAGFLFGENGDEGIIKMGSYKGNGSSLDVFLGYEPQYLLLKRTDTAENWQLLDSMRGWIHGENEKYLAPNTTAAEGSYGFGHPTATGFALDGSWQNGDGNTYIYVAVRRPDGYVGKPAAAGTDVFTMDTGASTDSLPNYDSGFPVDYAIYKFYQSTPSWYTASRLTGTYEWRPSSTHVQSTYDKNVWDSNVGYQSSSNDSTSIAYMWKRHQGFDVITYVGNGSSNRQLIHSMNKVPEMMWVKNRENSSDNWAVYHKDIAIVSGGTDSETDYLHLNNSESYYDGANVWQDTKPTANNFTIGSADIVNRDDDHFIAMLFTSVDGISKVGGYAGQTNDLTITTGFQPRFLLIKRINAVQNWLVVDTTRGWGSGTDQIIALNDNAAQSNSVGGGDIGAPTSTGFTLVGDKGDWCTNGSHYIYYAHA